MAKRVTRQVRAKDGRYEKNVRCESCNADLGQLDDGEWRFGPHGEFLCLDCAKTAADAIARQEVG